MYYLTWPNLNQHMAGRQPDLAQLLAQLYDNAPVPEEQPVFRNPKFVPTMTKEFTQEQMVAKDRVVPGPYFAELSRLATEADAYIAEHGTVYHTFHIPKASGGLRTIQAPEEGLKDLQRRIAHALQYAPNTRFPLVYAHNAAYAYVPGRSPKEALITHQQHRSKWFLKLDIKDFFPSIDAAFLSSTLIQLWPFCFIPHEVLLNLIRACTLDGKLPQGSPASPVLSNLVMLPYDKLISDILFNFEKHFYIYTRYADDLLISCRQEMKPDKITNIITTCLHNTPFNINRDKTRYGSSAGRNWNLGLMLNKDNKITVGHMTKQAMRAATNNFLFSARKGEPWSVEDTQVLIGELGYLKHIEPEYYHHIIRKAELKHHLAFQHIVKMILNHNYI